MRPTLPARARRARLVVLIVLLSNIGWLVALAVRLVRPPTVLAGVGFAVLLGGLAVAYALLLRTTVTAWVAPRTRTGLLVAVVVLTLALLPISARWAEVTEEPWAWITAFAVGVLPMVLSWRAAVALGAGLTAAAALTAVLAGGSVAQTLVITVGLAAPVFAVGQVSVWLLRLLVAAEAGREAEASLAVSQERLRFARDLHDVLGHRLSVIALQAEVVGSEEIRSLADTTLQDVRAAVHGYGTVDLTEQLDTARLVLTSAGIRADVRAAPVAIEPADSQLAAATVREAVTNVLRHSDASHVEIDLAAHEKGLTLLVRNDGVRQASRSGGLGLAGLAERAAQAGARLQAGAVGDRFEVRLELPAS